MLVGIYSAHLNLSQALSIYCAEYVVLFLFEKVIHKENGENNEEEGNNVRIPCLSNLTLKLMSSPDEALAIFI